MPEVGEGIWIKLGLDTSGVKKGLDETKSSLKDWRDKTNENTKDMAKWGAAITATIAPLAALTAASHRLVDEYGGMAQNLKDLSLVTEVSTGQLQKMRYNAVISGTDFNTVSASISRLTLSMAEARDSTSAAGKAFAELGVNPNGRSPDQVINDTTVALMGMEDKTKRNKIAMELYGKSWSQLIPYMDSYVRNADEIRNHPVLSDDDLRALEDAKTGWDKLGDAIYNAGAKATAAILKIQEAQNKFNPVAWGLDLLNKENSWDKGPNALITPETAAAKKTLFALSSKTGTASGTAAGTGGGSGGSGSSAITTIAEALTNPYAGGNNGSYIPQAAADTGLYGVDEYNRLLGELNNSPWISSSVRSQFGNLPATYSSATQSMSDMILHGDMNSPEYIKATMNAFGGMASRDELYSYYLGGRGGGGSVSYNLTQEQLNQRIKSITSTLAAEWERKRQYEAALGGNVFNISANDPLAAAAAVSQILAYKLNQAGVT